MSKLYDIANDYAKLMDSGLEPEMIADTIEGIDGELVDKVEQLLAICKNEQLYAEALRNESKSLQERASVVENKISSIKEYIARSLETAGKKSIRAGLHQVTVRVPSRQVDITDASILPIEFVEYETVVKPDKLAIKHQLDAGIAVPGAQIKLGKPSLIIK
ncbi:TPA: siphovirus Gp157 family protein [Serratia marcescens]|uniref:siphovirus Gp157 family protein n=1 Tax=Serratia TaxID=613 RepID=UPI0002B89F16|nr:MULTISPECIES: siphovirus Gp157 family protein [Serratia]EMF03331.1 prophage protein [Serratia marcescens VGH107]CAI0898976.1 Siphovirus Gp157 [Serratia entomophila]HEJ8029387.1 siphovirus Gp157 family protein [Serratia marcescens]HEJ8033617.1 siphovirus Gp157 family protein [Serratia marcescens]